MPESVSDGRGRRVCFVRHSFYPAELNVKREAEALVREGYDVSVICLRDKGEAPFELIEGVRIHRMPIGHKRGKIMRYLIEYEVFFVLASLKLLGLHFKKAFQFIQINTMPDYLVFVALIPKLFGTKVILHVHEPMPELFKTMFPQAHNAPLISMIQFFERLSVKFAHRALTVTREMRDKLGSRGADINKITVIVNVPDDEMFRLDRYRSKMKEVSEQKKEDRRKGKFRLITHGAIEERYGHDTVVRAVARVRDEIPGLEFGVLGKGSYLNGMLALARELKVEDRVIYKGFVDFDDMVYEILAADVGIVSMKSNPYSNLVHTNKMYEYMALQRPVIASRLQSVNSYFPDDTIVYYEPGNDEDLAEKIYYVFSHPEELDQRVEASNQIYETYRWERERKKYLGVYQGLAGEASRQTMEA